MEFFLLFLGYTLVIAGLGGFAGYHTALMIYDRNPQEREAKDDSELGEEQD